jgi:NAD(P)-dependent dehydrogenase (short-subunit alcohol dehydrogenase family)
MSITQNGGALNSIWMSLKTWRKLSLGPLALVYKFERAIPITSNRIKRADKDRRRSKEITIGESEATMAGRHGTTKVRGIAMIVGVGPGFGHALAYCLANEGFELILVSRNATRLAPIVETIERRGGNAIAYGCDATLESSVQDLFTLVRENHGIPSLVIYSIQSFGPGAGIDIEVAAFEDGWRHNCLGSFLVARSAARDMLDRKKGTIILVGSTSALIGRSGHLNLAVGKFGQRAIAQVLSRELWPKGIHVAHLIIDADIREDQTPADDETHSEPEEIAEIILQLHDQPKSAWTSEIDIRPWNEKFWEHC